MQTFKLNYESVIYIFLNVVNELQFQNIYILMRFEHCSIFGKTSKVGGLLSVFFAFIGSYSSNCTALQVRPKMKKRCTNRWRY